MRIGLGETDEALALLSSNFTSDASALNATSFANSGSGSDVDSDRGHHPPPYHRIERVDLALGLAAVLDGPGHSVSGAMR